MEELLENDYEGGEIDEAAKLTTEQRNALPDSDFALIQTDSNGNKVRRFPINDEAHVRNALARLPQAKDISDEEKKQSAILVLQRSDASPLYNKYQVEYNFLRAMKVTNIDSVLMKTAPEPKPDPKIVIESMKIAQKDKDAMTEIIFKMTQLEQEAKYLEAEVLEKQAQAALMLAQAKTVESGQQIAALQTSVALSKQKHEGVMNALHLLKELSQMDFENSHAKEQLALEKEQLRQAMQQQGEKVDSTSGMAGVEDSSSNS